MGVWDTLIALTPLFVLISIAYLQYEVNSQRCHSRIQLMHLQTGSMNKRIEKLERDNLARNQVG